MKLFFLLSKIFIELILGANFSEFVGPNKATVGVLARPIICIIPLSIDIAFSSLEAKAVTRAGEANLDSCSGNSVYPHDQVACHTIDLCI